MTHLKMWLRVARLYIGWVFYYPHNRRLAQRHGWDLAAIRRIALYFERQD